MGEYKRKMPIAGNNGNAASNSVNWAAQSLNFGSGSANKTSNNTALWENTTPEAFQKNGYAPEYAVGQFAWSTAQQANGAGENNLVSVAGWNLRRAFEGPVISFAVGTSSANAANGESVLVSNGSLNAYGIVTTNSSGNMTSVALGNSGGRFVNSSILAYSFTREKHLLTITVTANGGAVGNVYSNSDYVIASNGLVNSLAAVIVTNSSGNLVSVTPNTQPLGLGLWANNVANNTVVLTIYAANGATSNGTGATLTANLITSTGGAVTATLGGRSGRVQYEAICAMGSILQANCPNLPC
jgi:hypothetical protein